MDKEWWKFSCIFGAVTIPLWRFNIFFGFLGLIATVWCVCFFRDPKRVVLDDPDIILSPADGVVSQITDNIKPPSVWNMSQSSFYRVSIFMHVWNVHVNRTPIAGRIKNIFYKHGKFFNAALDKASEDNESQAIILENDCMEIAMVQIAGFIARRIRCDIRVGESLRAGQRVGMIRFGSRVDIYIPMGLHIGVYVGQTMIAGETVIASTIPSVKRNVNII